MFPMTVDLPGLELTIRGVRYNEQHRKRSGEWGTADVVFDCVDADGREGVVLWEYEWEWRDVTRDDLHTDRPEWVAALSDGDSFEFPIAYLSLDELQERHDYELPKLIPCRISG